MFGMCIAQGASEKDRESFSQLRMNRKVELTPNTCRWCKERFDLERRKPRTMLEWTHLRARLRMPPDDGTYIAICDNCWDGAAGTPTWIMGQVVPCADPEIVSNPSLRELLKASG